MPCSGESISDRLTFSTESVYFPQIIVTCVKRLYLRCAKLFEALRYKPEGHEFDSQLGYWEFSST